MTDPTPSIPPDADDTPPVVHPFVTMDRLVRRIRHHAQMTELLLVLYLEELKLPVAEQSNPKDDEALNAEIASIGTYLKGLRHMIQTYKQEKSHE
ncbi:unnamed protein product, partial [marine sediment metagenome]